MLALSILIHANLLISLNELSGKSLPFTGNAQVLTVNLSKSDNVSKLNQTQLVDTSISINADNKVVTAGNKSTLSEIKDQVVENKSESKINLDAPIYYTVSELDVVPAPLKDISQDLPQLDQFHSSGKLEVQLWLDINGTVEKAEVIETDLPENLKKIFVDNFLALKFTQAIKDNIQVKSTLKITLNVASES